MQKQLRHKRLSMILLLSMILTGVTGCVKQTMSGQTGDMMQSSISQSHISQSSKKEDTGSLKKYSISLTDLFDTVTQIIGFASSQEEFDGYVQKIRQTMTEYHQLYDIYHDYDGIHNMKTINDHAGKEAVTVDDRIIALLDRAIEIGQLTNGKMNVAYGAVLSVWHEYREQGMAKPAKAQLPPVELLREKSKHVDLTGVVIDHEKKTVYLPDAEMRLDVGAIAKGYATEMTAQMIEQAGMRHGMFSVGGNIRVIGTKLNDAGGEVAWNVGIQNPNQETADPVLKLLKLSGKQSLVTSGNYERYYTVNGKNYHHIIDPETLYPSIRYTSVSIVCEDSGLADALSTALFNMDIDAGKKLLGHWTGVEACWLLPDGSVELSDGFTKWEK